MLPLKQSSLLCSVLPLLLSSMTVCLVRTVIAVYRWRSDPPAGFGLVVLNESVQADCRDKYWQEDSQRGQYEVVKVEFVMKEQFFFSHCVMLSCFSLSSWLTGFLSLSVFSITLCHSLSTLEQWEPCQHSLPSFSTTATCSLGFRIQTNLISCIPNLQGHLQLTQKLHRN